MSNFDISMEEAAKKAEANGCEVVQGDLMHLLIDLDDVESAVQYIDNLKMVHDKFGVNLEESWQSKSGGMHIHVRLTLAVPLPAAHRVALQAALGSDPAREILSMWRIANGIEEPSLLFRPKDGKVVTRTWEEVSKLVKE